MLTKSDNELICRVGPETPMNELMKRYWIPAGVEDDLPVADGAPKRIKLLGEKYILFRNTDGVLAMMDEQCVHRGASLALARVEENGIRCIYHGWKFAADGSVMDIPIVSDVKLMKTRFKARTYPLREAGGLLWAYLGPKEKEPPFPEYPYMSLPRENRLVVRVIMDCNWVQVLEGALDSAHVGILHKGIADELNAQQLDLPSYMRIPQILSSDNAPRIEVQHTDFGLHYAALRKLDDGRDGSGVRVTSFIFPFGTMVPPGTQSLYYVPYDDYTTAWTAVLWNRNEPVERDKSLRLQGLDVPGVWVNDHLELHESNNWGQDRELMARGHFSGLAGFHGEDGAVQLSMGPIMDRSIEHLVPSDLAIIRTRQLLLDGVARIQRGEDPLFTAPSNTKGISSVDAYVPPGQPWQVAVPTHVELADPRRKAVAA